MSSRSSNSVGVLSRRNFILPVFGIALVLYLFVFGRVLDNYFVGDDWAFLDEVSRVRALSDIAAFFSFGTPVLVRPLEKVVTWLLYSGFGPNVVVFHMLSLLLDLANTVLLGLLAFLLFRTEKQPNHPLVFWATAVSILFAFNWTHHEAVFWYSAINEPLTAFFRLSGIVLFVLMMSTRGVLQWGLGAGIVGLAVLALIAKESAVVFPIELFLFFIFFRVQRPRRQLRAADVVVLVLVSLVVLGWLALYWTGAPPGVIENGRGGVKLTPGVVQDWQVRIPFVFNSTTLGLDVLSTEKRMGLELAAGFVLTVLAIFRRRFVWLLALAWTIVIMLPYAALFPASEMTGYLLYTFVTLPVRYFYFITAGAGLLLVSSVMWLQQEIESHFPGRILSLGFRALACIALVTLVTLNVLRILQAENEWDISGQTVLRISRQIEPFVTNLKRNDTLCLANLPDNYHFKLTFRNAAWGVVYLTYKRADFKIVAMTDRDQPVPLQDCTVRLSYDPASKNFAYQ